MSAEQVRLPGPGLDLDALFLFEAKRRVQRDRTVSLNGTLFEVDAALVGHTVTLRYDPERARQPRRRSLARRTLRRPRHARWMPTPTASCAATGPPRPSITDTPPRRPAQHRRSRLARSAQPATPDDEEPR